MIIPAAMIALSAGTSSNYYPALTFSNASGVLFGLDGSTITASVKTDYQTSGAYLTTAMQSQSSSVFARTGFTTTTQGLALMAGTLNTDGLKLGVPAFLTTAMQSASSSVFAKTGFTTTTIAGAVVAGTHNTDGLLLAVPAYLTTAQSPGAYLTTAMASNRGSDFVAATAAFAGTSASGTIASNGISISIGPYLTTAMQSASSSVFAKTGFTTTTIAGAVVAGTHDTAGLLLAVPAYLTTAQAPGAYLTTAMASNRGSDFVAASAAFAGTSASGTIASNGISISIGPYLTTAALSNHSHGNPTLNLTNLSGTTASASNGFTLSLSAAAGGGAVVSNALQDVASATGSGTNTSRFAADDHVHRGVGAIAAVGTASTFYGSVHFSAGNNITLSTGGATNAGTIAIHAAAPGGAATYSNFFQPFDLMGSQTATSIGSLSQLHLLPFSVPVNLSFGQINMIASVPVLNTGVVGTWSIRLTSTAAMTYEANYTISNTNFIDCFLFSRGSGGYSSELETFAWTRNSFITLQSLTFGATANHTAGSTGSMSARQSCSMSISYPMITSGTMTSVNAASTFTTWGMGYTTWNSTASTSVSNTYNTTTTGSTSIASTMVGTTAWSSWKLVPLNWARSLTPGEYWLGMVRYSSTSSSSVSASTNAAPGTGASFTVTFNASALTRTQDITWLGQTTSLASSLGWLGFVSQASMAPKQGHGSFSGTWASNTTYLNNGGNPAGAVAFSQIRTGVSFFQSWIQMQSNGI